MTFIYFWHKAKEVNKSCKETIKMGNLVSRKTDETYIFLNQMPICHMIYP